LTILRCSVISTGVHLVCPRPDAGSPVRQRQPIASERAAPGQAGLAAGPARGTMQAPPALATREACPSPGAPVDRPAGSVLCCRLARAPAAGWPVTARDVAARPLLRPLSRLAETGNQKGAGRPATPRPHGVSPASASRYRLLLGQGNKAACRSPVKAPRAVSSGLWGLVPSRPKGLGRTGVVPVCLPRCPPRRLAVDPARRDHRACQSAACTSTRQARGAGRRTLALFRYAYLQWDHAGS
jgi:hypothetical protein